MTVAQDLSDWVGAITGSSFFTLLAHSPKKLSLMYGVSYQCVSGRYSGGAHVARLVVSILGFALWILVPFLMTTIFFTSGYKNMREYYNGQCFGQHGALELVDTVTRVATPTYSEYKESTSIQCFTTDQPIYSSTSSVPIIGAISKQDLNAPENFADAYCYNKLTNAQHTAWGNRTINGYDAYADMYGTLAPASSGTPSPDYKPSKDNVVYRLWETVGDKKGMVREGSAMFIFVVSAVAAVAYAVDALLCCTISNPRIFAKEKDDEPQASSIIVRHRFGRYASLLVLSYIVAFNLLGSAFLYTLARGDVETQFHDQIYNGQLRDPILQLGMGDSYVQNCGCFSKDSSAVSSNNPFIRCADAPDAFELHAGCWVAPLSCPQIGSVTVDTFLECQKPPKSPSNAKSSTPWAAKDSSNCPTRKGLYEARRDNFYRYNLDDSNSVAYHIDHKEDWSYSFDRYAASEYNRKPTRNFFGRHMIKTFSYFTSLWKAPVQNVHPLWSIGTFLVNVLSLSSATTLFVTIVMAATSSNQNIVNQASATLRNMGRGSRV